jgi:hypothetical protein
MDHPQRMIVAAAALCIHQLLAAYFTLKLNLRRHELQIMNPD